MIYVPAQTHLIYSAKHNSLTLFWGKTVVYLGYATKSRKLRHSYVHSTPAPSIFPRYFTFRLFLFAILLSFTHYINHRVPCTFFATLSLFLFLSLRVAINTRSISYFLLDPAIANAMPDLFPIKRHAMRYIYEQVFRVYAFDLLFPRVQINARSVIDIYIYKIRVTRKLTQATIFVRKPVVRKTRRHKSSSR